MFFGWETHVCGLISFISQQRQQDGFQVGLDQTASHVIKTMPQAAPKKHMRLKKLRKLCLGFVPCPLTVEKVVGCPTANPSPSRTYGGGAKGAEWRTMPAAMRRSTGLNLSACIASLHGQFTTSWAACVTQATVFPEAAS
jgi:hypothetical protein